MPTLWHPNPAIAACPSACLPPDDPDQDLHRPRLMCLNPNPPDQNSQVWDDCWVSSPCGGSLPAP